MSYPYGYSINEFGRFDVGGYGAVPDGPRRVRSLDQAKMVAARAWIIDGKGGADSTAALKNIAKNSRMPWAKGKTIGGVLGMAKKAVESAEAKSYITKMAKEYWDHTHPERAAVRKEAEAATEEPTAVVKYAPAPLPSAAPMPIAAAGTGMPGWVLPVGLGVGVLALLLLVTRPPPAPRRRAGWGGY